MSPTDSDVPPDPAQDVPDITATDESAGDLAARNADEGMVGPYTVQTGMRVERNGVLLEAGVQIWFTTAEQTAGVVSDLITRKIIA